VQQKGARVGKRPNRYQFGAYFLVALVRIMATEWATALPIAQLPERKATRLSKIEI
jgi:hypothetical protein